MGIKNNLTFRVLIVQILLLAFVSGIVIAESNDVTHLNAVDIDKSSLEVSNYVESFDVMTPDISAFKEDVKDGNIKLKLLEKEFELRLQETHFISDDAKIIEENETGIYFIDAPKIYTYKGEVVGVKDSSVSLTISDNVVIGFIKVGDKSYTLDQTNQKVDGKVLHVAYDSDSMIKRETTEYAVCGVEEEESSFNAIQSLQMTPLLLSGVDHVDFLPCYGKDFRDEYTDPQAEIASMINTVNNEYAYANAELDIHFYKRYDYLPDYNARGAYDFFEVDIPPYRDITDSDLAMLFYGKDFVGINGSVIGLADPYTGSAGQAYSVVQMVSGGILSSYDGTYDSRCTLIAHEFGHNFGATHDEAYSWGLYTTHHTAMTAFFMDVYPHYMELQFSDVNRQGSTQHNNIANIDANAATVAGFKTP